MLRTVGCDATVRTRQLRAMPPTAVAWFSVAEQAPNPWVLLNTINVTHWDQTDSNHHLLG